jgi:hypothetical protein
MKAMRDASHSNSESFRESSTSCEMYPQTYLLFRDSWECARILASLLFSNMRNIEDVTVK